MKDGGTHYARNGSVRLAYRVLGEGDTTLVWNPGWFSNVDLWTDPALPFVSFVEALARGTRLVLWDKRGTGLSDPVTHVPPLDERMDDLHAVLDAVGVETAAFYGVSEGGPMSILFAATYPERVQSLALYGTMTRFSPEMPNHPWGWNAEQTRAMSEAIESDWGEGALADMFFGPIAQVPGFKEIYGRRAAGERQPHDDPDAPSGTRRKRRRWRGRFGSHADAGHGQDGRRDRAHRRATGPGRGDAQRAVPRDIARPARTPG